MADYVLFSPIGDTDPVRDNFDGPMLHILRHYKPSKVTLFLTSKMQQREELYGCLAAYTRHVCPNIQIQTIFSGIEDASDFSAFEDEYIACLRDLAIGNLGSTILLNISSGTPQMIAELCILASTVPYAVLPVQVTTPVRDSNAGTKHFDPKTPIEDALAELLDENVELYQQLYGRTVPENRCREVKLENYIRRFLYSGIRSQIDSGDFVGAALQSYKFREYLPALFLHSVQGASYRQTYEISKARRCFDDAGIDVIPIQDGEYAEILEYYLRMRQSFKRGDYSPFIVQLSPLAFRGCLFYVKGSCLPQLDGAIVLKSNGAYLNVSAFKELFPEVCEYLVNRLSMEKNEVRLSLQMLLIILEYCMKTDAKHAQILNAFDWLRKMEYELRNSIAHTMRPITKDDIEKTAECSANKVLKKIEDTLIKVYSPRIRHEMFSSYEKMGGKILDLLQD